MRKSLKRIIAMVLVVALALSVSVQAFAAKGESKTVKKLLGYDLYLNSDECNTWAAKFSDAAAKETGAGVVVSALFTAIPGGAVIAAGSGVTFGITSAQLSHYSAKLWEANAKGKGAIIHVLKINYITPVGVLTPGSSFKHTLIYFTGVDFQ